MVAVVAEVVLLAGGGFLGACVRGARALPALRGSDEIPIFWLTICVATSAIAPATRSPTRASSGQRREDLVIALRLRLPLKEHAPGARSRHVRRGRHLGFPP